MLKQLLSLLKEGSLMDQAYNETVEMINVLGNMFDMSVDYLHSGKVPAKEEDTYTLDKRVNLLEQKLRRHIYTHLVLNKQQDLYMSLILVQIGVDLERVGDYIKNIYDLRRIIGDLSFNGAIEELTEMEDKIRKMVPRVKAALEKQDSVAATQIQKDYFPLAKLCDQRVEEILTGSSESESCKNAAMLALYYRYLKRVVAHLINVASAISNPYDRIGFHPDDII
ncbi:MAG: hypothetical protein CO090_09485 [Acidobacteria bacterium CG_4_9_14_3_um_filter_49_7]|nr:MAG: hypothetical protein CO090_09485 [Acidobacteria bacterium CG_4_9_14_3_um_filter_49_7]